MVHNGDKPCFVDPDAGAYFELKEDDFFEVLPVIPKDVTVRYIATLVEAQKTDSPCRLLIATAGESEWKLEI